MNKNHPTRLKILKTSQQLFNSKGFAVTSVNDIATAIGISKGNVTYHFPTKRDIANALIFSAREMTLEHRSRQRSTDIAEDYIGHVVFAMTLTWDFQFVFRDLEEFADSNEGRRMEYKADYLELTALLKRVKQEGLFRKDVESHLEQLTRTLWILGRYWMNYVREFEGKTEITWQDQEAGIRQHISILSLGLNAAGQKRFDSALKRASADKTE